MKIIVLCSLFFSSNFLWAVAELELPAVDFLSAETSAALRSIGNHEGLALLHYDLQHKKWSVDNSFYTNPWILEQRLALLPPLAALLGQLQIEFVDSVTKSPQAFYLLRRAYFALNLLYHHFLINPCGDKQYEHFTDNFYVLLEEFNALLFQAKSKIKKAAYQEFMWEEAVEQKEGVSELVLSEKYPVLKKAYAFTPKSISSLKPKSMAVFAVHGTFADGSISVDTDDNWLKNAMKMADALAESRGRRVELYSFEWSGANDNEARLKAGLALANFVEDHFDPNAYEDVFVGHSHGGNVIFSAGHAMAGYRVMGTLITLATSIRSDFIPYNFDNAFLLYDPRDWVQWGASFELTMRATETYRSQQKPYYLAKADIERAYQRASRMGRHMHSIYNMRVLEEGHECSSLLAPISSHNGIKTLLKYVPHLMQTALAYPVGSHLDVHWLKQAEKAHIAGLHH